MYNPNEDSNNIAPTTARKSASVDIRQIFPARKKDDFLKDLQKDVNTFSKYLDLNNEWRNRFEEFMGGNKSLPLTYDPFFKALFNPDFYPGRLSHLLSSIIGINVTVQSVLSQENRLLPTSPLLIMDIIVQLEDGSIANVEIPENTLCIFWRAHVLLFVRSSSPSIYTSQGRKRRSIHLSRYQDCIHNRHV